MNEKIMEHQPKSPQKTAALEYLDRIKKGKRHFIQNFKQQCPDQVSFDDMKELFEEFYRSYDLRMTLAGDKKEDDSEDILPLQYEGEVEGMS